MKLREKCIYYIPSTGCHYLVLSISDMVYGRCGDMTNPSYLDSYMNQNGTGVRFKIDDIVINRDCYRNYYLNDEELGKFELVKELTDEEFYPMKLLIDSNIKFPVTMIDIHQNMANVSDIIDAIKYKKWEIEKLQRSVGILETALFNSMK